MDIELTKVNQIGTRYLHHFQKLDGDNSLPEVIKVETSEEDYEQLASTNPSNPSREGYKWLFSCSDVKYDTASGDLEDNQYAKTGNRFIVKLPTLQTYSVKEEAITNDILSGVTVADAYKEGFVVDEDVIITKEYIK